MANGDARDVFEIRADGDEMSVQAAYAGGAVPGATYNEWQHTMATDGGYGGGTRPGPVTATGDEPADYIGAGLLDDNWEEQLSYSPEQQWQHDHQQADEAYTNARIGAMDSALNEVAQGHDIDAEALRQATEETGAALLHSVMQQTGASQDEVIAEMGQDPAYWYREIALTAAAALRENSARAVALPHLESAASRAARR